MHLRLSTVTRQGKTYRYAQLVESYRRPNDGLPAHRVVGNLGQLSDAEIENVRNALAGNRRGKDVTVAKAPAPRQPKANLRYLDLAVLLDMWRELGLDSLLEKLLGRGQMDTAPADVVVALVVQRCIAPGSKLYAERWFPRTALPELLAIDPARFNNTRLHRVLDALDVATPALMSRLPLLYLEHDRRPAFATLYLDVTDAHFIGHGPKNLTARGKTKEGLIQRKIGIVLLCNERGYPLKWSVVAGNASDCTVMTEMFEAMAKSHWAQGVPIICDRAMGTTAQLRDMANTGLQFLTALKTTEFDVYAPTAPYDALAALDVPDHAQEEIYARIRQLAAERAQDDDMEHVTDTLWVKDFGVLDVDPLQTNFEIEPQPRPKTVAEALQLGKNVEAAVRDGQFKSFNAAGRAHGLNVGTMKAYRLMCRLPSDVQDAILSGQADNCSLAELIRISQVTGADRQRTTFADLLKSASNRSTRPSLSGSAAPSRRPFNQTPLRVRVAVYFNPERFVDQRLKMQRQQAAITSFIRDLNQRLENPKSTFKRASVLATVEQRLRRDDLLTAYQVDVIEAEAESRTRYQVVLEPLDAEWQRRRRYHGFSLLVGHPDLRQTAAQLCTLYRAKDTVEKDFQVIKSLVKLRPIRHQTATKVCAHVTICMLALILERHLRQKLGGLCSAESALEALATCHLNQYRGSNAKSSPVYSLTEPSAEQIALLRRLNMPLLGDNDDLATRITPRASV